MLALEILSDVGSYAGVQRMLWFDWLSPLYGLYQSGTETGTGALVFRLYTYKFGYPDQTLLMSAMTLIAARKQTSPEVRVVPIADIWPPQPPRSNPEYLHRRGGFRLDAGQCHRRRQ
jgi:hypothetical protein